MMAYQGNQIDYKNLNDELKLKIDKVEGVESQVQALTPKVDNSWQKGVYNDTDITNVGDIDVSRVFHIVDWKAPVGNIEQVSIVIPVAEFMGTVKVSVTGSWMVTNGSGAFEYETYYLKVGNTVHKHNRTIYKADTGLTNEYYFPNFNFNEELFTIPIVRRPNATNRLSIKVELLGVYKSFNMLKDAYIVFEDLGTSWTGYPWTPQAPTALMASTYNASNTITNIGANRATRVFPQINWQAQGIELWESFINLPASLWGILELDIAGYSAASGGAKIVVELGINVIGQTQPSSEFRNFMKVVSASAGFTENFYVEIEHRAEHRMLLIKIYKRVLNDPITVTTTFTSTASPMSAFEFLKGFNNGALYTNIASVPTARQKDFDSRITENFTSVSNGKKNIASAITGKGVQTASDATFETIANNINAIPTLKSAKGTFNVPALSPYGKIAITIGTFSFNPKNISSNLAGAQIANGMDAQTPNQTGLKGDYYQITNNNNGTWTVVLNVWNMDLNNTSSARTFYFCVTE